MTLSDIADVLHPRPIERKKYSICTLVSRTSDYVDMQQSFISHGFSYDCTQFLVADNTIDNGFDAYSAYNRFLGEAYGEYIILCHQDVVLLDHSRERLDDLILEMDRLDPNWGVLGNAGRADNNVLVSRITDPHNTEGLATGGPLPRRVMSLDENFIVTKRLANLALSRDIDGFHYYGADLCIIADILGFSSYVIDFHLLHRSGGHKDESFYQLRKTIQLKFRRAFRTRHIYVTTDDSFLVSGSSLIIFSNRILGILRRVFHRLRGSSA